jgi:hypothetical protein
VNTVRFVAELAILATVLDYFVRATGRRSASVAFAPVKVLLTPARRDPYGGRADPKCEGSSLP